MVNKKKKKISLFIYPTYKCLGNCLFCYIDKESRVTKEELTLNEAKKNIYYFKKKYLIDEIVIMGGEVFLWSEIMPFIYFIVNDYFPKHKLNGFVITTEALECSSIKVVNDLEKIFVSNKFYPYFQIPLNTCCTNNKIIKQRREAILNLSKRNFNVRYILFFTKNNFQAIKNEAIFLANIFSKYYKAHPDNFSIELRLPFSLGYEIFIPQYNQFIKIFSYVYKIFVTKKIHLLLRNIPFCYLNLKEKDLEFIRDYNFKKIVKKKIIKINKKSQLDSAKIMIYNTSHCESFPKCSFCILKNQCNSIDPVCINYFNYPDVKPFIKR